MKKPAKLRIAYGKTINLGNYESQRLDIEMEISIDEKDYEIESQVLFEKLTAQFDALLRGLL